MVTPLSEDGTDATASAAAAAEAVLAARKQLIDAVPDVEWWDASILPNRTYDDVRGAEPKIRDAKIRLLVEHPVPIQPPAEPSVSGPLPLYLTKKERKKIRTQSRIQREKEKQEKIALGLMAPPPPRLTIANMMRVLGSEASSDPTRVEAIVREQQMQRMHAHQLRNEQQKLTPEQRRDKKRRKLLGDPSASVDVSVALYKVNEIPDAQKKWKVDINAQQLCLSGCVIMTDSLTMIAAEGSEKALRRFTKLLTHRIDWNKTLELESAAPTPDGPSSNSTATPSSSENTAAAAAGSDSATGESDLTAMEIDGGENGGVSAQENDDNHGDSGNNSSADDDSEDEDHKSRSVGAGSSQTQSSRRIKCKLVWQGKLKKPSFHNFRFQKFVGDVIARKYLKDHGCEHYFDMCASFDLNKENIDI